MPFPLKPADHGRLPTDRLAEHIRERVQKLGHFYENVRGCRVSVDGPGQHPLQGRIRVRISGSAPGSQIAINRQSGEDLPMAIRESFDAADQRLEDDVRLDRQSAKGAKRRPRRGT